MLDPSYKPDVFFFFLKILITEQMNEKYIKAGSAKKKKVVPCGGSSNSCLDKKESSNNMWATNGVVEKNDGVFCVASCVFGPASPKEELGKINRVLQQRTWRRSGHVVFRKQVEGTQETLGTRRGEQLSEPTSMRG